MKRIISLLLVLGLCMGLLCLPVTAETSFTDKDCVRQVSSHDRTPAAIADGCTGQ